MPIIIITGHGTLDMAINAMRLGAQGFLLKPFTPEELSSAVAEALEKTRLLNENIRMRALMPLFEVSTEIISEIDTKRLVRLIIDIAVQEAAGDKAWLAFMDEESGTLELKVCHGLSSHSEPELKRLQGGSSWIPSPKKPSRCPSIRPFPKAWIADRS